MSLFQNIQGLDNIYKTQLYDVDLGEYTVMHIEKIMISILLACIPAIIWGYIFYKKEPEPRIRAAITFIAGMLAVVPILLYKYSWKYFPDINFFLYTNTLQEHSVGFGEFIAIPLSVIAAFMIVGILEEYMKHWVVKITDGRRFCEIDDALEYSIMAALGFAFVENIMYFVFIWITQGVETLFVSFVFRSIFSTFAHILFSGIYGYYYGIAVFASPIFQENIRNSRFFLTNLLHKIIGIRRQKIFKREKITEGLLFAVILHAFFNVMLEMNWVFMMVPFLILGYIMLDYLFKKKEDHKAYGLLLTNDSENQQYCERITLLRKWMRIKQNEH